MISIEAIDDAYILMILDDGPGMSPEQIEAAYGIGVRHDPSLPGPALDWRSLGILQPLMASSWR
jgi:hypothetical protein